MTVPQLLWAWYGQVWPNLAASAVSLPVAFVWAHRRAMRAITKDLEKRLAKHHEQVKEHVDRALAAQPPGGTTP